MDVRNTLAKLIFEADLDLGEVSVKDLVDLMMEAAHYGARKGYDQGVNTALRFPDVTSEDKEYFINTYFPLNPRTRNSVIGENEEQEI